MFQSSHKMPEESLPAKAFYSKCLNRTSEMSEEDLLVISEMGRNFSEFGGDTYPTFRPDDWLAYLMLHDLYVDQS